MDIVAVLLSICLIIFANRRKEAVGRREIQLVLGAYMLLSFCDIFTTGRVLPELSIGYFEAFTFKYTTEVKALLTFTSLQVGFLVAFFWMLMCFGLVGLQVVDDGTVLSVGLTLGSGLVLGMGSFYIAMDTGFGWTVFDEARLESKSIGLYILYLGVPLFCAVIYAISQFWIIFKVINDLKPIGK
jgi:hypothetical protein